MANLLQSIKSGIYKAGYKAGELAESAGKEIEKAKEGAVQLGKDLVADPVTAMENFSKAAEKPVSQIVEAGATAGKYVGAGLDTINPANLGSNAMAKVLGTEYKPVNLGQPIGEAIGETVGTMTANIGTLPIKLSESTFKVNKDINDYQSGIIDTKSAALTIADEIGKGSLAVIGSIAPVKYAKMVTGIQTVMRESGLSDYATKVTDVIGNTIADTLNVKDEKQREQVRSLTNTSQGILSLRAGMKGGAMAKQGKTLAETAKNVTKGTLTAAIPDLATVALGQAMGVGEEEGSNIDAVQTGKMAAASVLGAFSPAEGMNVKGKSKAKAPKEQTSMEVEVPKAEEVVPKEIDRYEKFTQGMTPTKKALTIKKLKEDVNYKGEIMPRAEYLVNKIKDDNLTNLREIDVPKYKEPTRVQYNRMNNKEQEAVAKKIKEGGTVKDYSISNKEGRGIILSKTEFDFLTQVLNGKEFPVAKKQVPEQKKDTPEQTQTPDFNRLETNDRAKISEEFVDRAFKEIPDFSKKINKGEDPLNVILESKELGKEFNDALTANTRKYMNLINEYNQSLTKKPLTETIKAQVPKEVEASKEQTSMEVEVPKAEEQPVKSEAQVAEAKPPKQPKAKKPLTETVKEQTPKQTFEQKFTLPDSLKKGGGDYGMYAVDFGNDFYRALYVIRENKKGARSDSDDKYLKAVMEQTGLSEKDARLLGNTVLQNIKDNEASAQKVPGVKKPVIKLDSNLFGDVPTGETPVVKSEPPVKSEPKQPRVKKPLTETVKETTTVKTEAPTQKIAVKDIPPPRELLTAKVEKFNYGTDIYNVDFGGNINKALYLAKGMKAKKPPSYPIYIKWLKSVTGLSEQQLNNLGDAVHNNIKSNIKNGNTSGKNVSVDVDFFTGEQVKPTQTTGAVIEPQAKIVGTAPRQVEQLTPEQTQQVMDKLTGKTTKTKKPLAETVKGKTKERQPEQLTPEQTQQVMDKLEGKTTEDTTIPFEAPKKSELTDDTIPFEDTTKKKKDERKYQPNYQAVKTDIDNIMGNLTPENVSVSRTAGALDSVFTIGGLVERGLGKAKEAYITLRNLMQTARNSDPVFYDSMKKTMDVDYNDYLLGRKFDVTEDMVVGRLTPNDEMPITSLAQVKETIDNIIPDDIVSREGKEAAEAMRDTAKASYVYELNKDNPEFLAKTFTPDELVKLEAISAKEKEITNNTGNILIDKGLLPDWKKVDDYIRFVLNGAFRKKMGVAFDILQKKKQEEFETRMISQMLNKTEKGMVIEENKNIQGLDSVGVSSLKEKSDVKELDYQRIHSPLIRMYSVLSETSKALRNKTLTDQVKEFVKLGASKKASQADKDFVKRMFPKDSQNMVAAVMGLEAVETTPIQKAAGIASWFTRAGVKLIMLGNPVTALQPMFSTLPKGLYIAATRSFKGLTNPFLAGSESVLRDLGAFGFTPPLEVINTRRPGIITRTLAKVGNPFGWFAQKTDDVINKGVALSSGSWLEYPVKVYTSLTMMKSELARNGIEATTNPKDITAKWKEFSKNPDKKAEFQQAQDKIQETLSWLGESTIFNKSAVQTIRETDLQALKGYMNSQTNKLLRDISVASGRTEASGRQRVAAVERTAVGTLIFAGAIYSIMQVLASETDEEDDDKTMSERFWLALPMAQRMVGWSPLMLGDSVAGSLASPITVPFKLLSEAVNTVYAMGLGNDAEKAVAYGRFLDTVLKNTGVGKTATSASDVFTGKTLQEKASDTFGIVNMEDISKAGIARGRKTETQGEAWAKALGFDIDAATNDYLWGRFDEMDLEAKYLAKTGSPLMASVGAKIVSSIKGLGRDFVRPLQDISGVFDPASEGYDMSQMGVIRQTADMLNEQDSLKSYLVKLGVTNPEAQFAIRDEVNKQFNSLSGTNIDKARFIKEDGRTIEELADTENFGRDMKTMLTENPKLFNDILAGLARVYRNADDLKEFTPEMREKVKEYMKPSRMGDDAAIAAYYGTSPTTTSLSNALSQGIEDVMKVEKPKDSKLTDAEFALEQLKFIDDSFKSVYVVMPITRSVERSLALKSTELTTKLDKLAETLKIPKTKILDNLPYITRAIDRGLDYRGFREYGETNDISTSSDGKSNDVQNNLSLSESILNKTPGTLQTPAIATNPILIEKVKAYDPMKLTPVASQIKQTTQAKSGPRLADLLKR